MLVLAVILQQQMASWISVELKVRRDERTSEVVTSGSEVRVDNLLAFSGYGSCVT